MSPTSFAIPVHVITDQQNLLPLAVPLASMLGSMIVAVIALKQNKVARDTLAHNRVHLYREFLYKRLETLRAKSAALLDKTWTLVTEDAALTVGASPEVTQSIFELRLALDQNDPDQVTLDRLLSEFWIVEDRHAWHDEVLSRVRNMIRSTDGMIRKHGFDDKTS